MPTVFRVGPYRFFFFSNEGNEPVHVHVEASDSHAKFWLDPIRLARSSGFGNHEIAEIRRIIETRVDEIKDRWNEHFRNA